MTHTSRRYSNMAAQRRALWVEHHRRRPTEVQGPQGEPLFALIHRSVKPVLPTPIASHRVTPELAWRVADERFAVLITLRGKLAASLRPLVLKSECENLTPDELLACDGPGFCGQRNAVLEAMSQGEGQRVLLQLRDLLLAQLQPLPPSSAACRLPLPSPSTPTRTEAFLSLGDEELEPSEDAPDEEPEASSLAPTGSLSFEQRQRVELHTDLVRRLARRVSYLLGSRALSRRELESAGNEGLVRAASRYDPNRPTPFRTFAHYRVYGAMLDAIRQEWHSSGYYEHPLVHLAAASNSNPEQALIAADQRLRVRALIEQLKPRERELVEAVYVEERSMSEFARESGVHTSTISRRHGKILERLGKRMLAQERELALAHPQPQIAIRTRNALGHKLA